jgi:hypothetical protein
MYSNGMVIKGQMVLQIRILIFSSGNLFIYCYVIFCVICMFRRRIPREFLTLSFLFALLP